MSSTTIPSADGKGALHALGEELAATDDVAQARPILSSVLDLLVRAPAEAETAVSLFARAEERFGADRAIVEGRAHVHQSAGHHEAALQSLQKLAALVPDEAGKASVWERMGDIAKNHLAQPQQALIHYQAAFKADRANRVATRKASKIYLEL